MNGRFVNRLTSLLLLLCLMLGGVVAWELRHAAAMDATRFENLSAPADTPPPVMKSLPASLPKTTLQVYQDILARPLFRKDRRPPEPQAAPAAVAKTVLPLRLVLEGVALTREKRIALLRDLSSNELLSVEQGSTHNDWTVSSVQPDRVTVSRDGRVQELLLEPPANSPPVPVPQTRGAAKRKRLKRNNNSP